MKLYERINGEVVETACEASKFETEFDVIVVGAGSGGVYAALAAARENRRVLLLEKSQWCGGQHIQGLVNGYYYGFREGLFRQTDRQAKETMEGLFYDVATDGKRILVAKALENAKVEVHTLSMPTGVFAEEKHIRGIRALVGREMKTYGCKMLIDATADAHVLRLLPIAMKMGRAEDGESQPFSSVRSVYLDSSKYDGGLSVTVGKMGERYGLFHQYRDNGYVNQYDPEAFTKALIRAHASHLKFMDPRDRFLYMAPMIGLREGLLYEGEDFLTLDDVLHGRVDEEKAMLTCYSDVDKHGSGTAFDEEIYQDWFVCTNMSTCTIYIPVPMGAVVPKGWKGLTTAGRCISSDTYVNSAIRMNTDCFRIGEASGTLSALAVDYDGDPMAVPLEKLRETLAGYGFYDGEKIRNPSFWNPGMKAEDRVMVQWMTGPEEIKAALSTDTPAVALWSCHLAGKEKLGDAVFAMTQSTDDMLRKNAAIALGVMRDDRARPILHEIIRQREPFYYMDCRRSNQMRSVIAICLCGQMRDESAVDVLLPILEKEEFEKEMYHTLLEPDYKRTITKEQNSVYFQHLSHTVVALTKIAAAHPDRAVEIKTALHKALDNGEYIRRITDTPDYNAFHIAAENCRKYVHRFLG